jgi:3-methyladenine DNA glycosylase AlkC
MQKKIERMPKKTKHDIREKRKEYELMKKEMLNNARKQIKEDNEKITRASESGQDMIKYINEENDKVKELINTIQKEQRVLEKQFEILTAKSEDIALNFKSLQTWVDKKNESVKKNEASDQKCRHRYLPKYREDLKLRNRYCISEFRVKELYKRQIEKIIKEVEAQSTDPNLVKYVQKEMKALHEMPENPLPEGLEHRLKKY